MKSDPSSSLIGRSSDNLANLAQVRPFLVLTPFFLLPYP